MRKFPKSRLLGVLKISVAKLKYGRALSASAFQANLSMSTEITCGNGGKMSLGRIGTATNVHLVSYGGELSIGTRCGFNRNDIVVCRYKISIGDDCNFGPNMCIYDHDHAFGKDGKIDGQYKHSEIVIEDNVWIGAGVIVLRGTHIGKNSVIGTGCVVKGNIPPNSLVTMNRDLNIELLR